MFRPWMLSLLLAPAVALGNSTPNIGTTGNSGINGTGVATTCAQCHAGAEGTPRPVVTIEGPAALTAGQTAVLYTVRISAPAGVPRSLAGMNAAVSGPATLNAVAGE